MHYNIRVLYLLPLFIVILRLLGIGKTSLIEPFVAIEATNQLQELRSQLRREESCIYIEMCAVVHGFMHEIRQSVQAAAELDVLSAKARFGKEINGIIPQVILVLYYIMCCTDVLICKK